MADDYADFEALEEPTPPQKPVIIDATGEVITTGHVARATVEALAPERVLGLMSQDFVRSKNCKICNLPDDLREEITASRLDDQVSLEELAKRVTSAAMRRGLNIKPATAMNLSNHFRKHGSQDDRAQYLMEKGTNVIIPKRPNLADPLEAVMTVVGVLQTNASAVADLSDVLDHARDNFDQITDELRAKRQRLQEARRKHLAKEGLEELKPEEEDKFDLGSHDLRPFVTVNKEIRSTIESLSKIINPGMVVELFLDAVLHQYSKELVTHFNHFVKDFVETIGEESEKRGGHLKPERVETIMRQKAREWVASARSSALHYESRVTTIMGGN